MNTTEALLAAAARGQLQELQLYITAGVGVDERDIDGNTALHVAAANGQLQCVSALLRAGAAVNAVNNVGCSALMQAARHGRSQVVAQLIQHGANVNAVNDVGVSALCMAATGGSITVLRTMMDSGASVKDGHFSPVVVAAMFGHEDILRVMLDRGCSSNSSNSHTLITPLMAAASENNGTLTHQLLSRGAHPNTTNAAHHTALQVATLHSAQDVVNILTPLTDKELMTKGVLSALDAVCQGNIRALGTMLTEASSVTTPAHTEQRVTALHAAAVLGDHQAAELLIMHGADVNAVDAINGWTPLFYSVHFRQSRVTELLLAKGADVTVTTPQGHTLLHLAAEVNDYDVIRAFVAARAIEDVSKVSPEHSTIDNSLSDTQNKRWWSRPYRWARSRNTAKSHLPEGNNTVAPVDDSGHFPLLPPVICEPIIPNQPPRYHMGAAGVVPHLEHSPLLAALPSHLTDTSALLERDMLSLELSTDLLMLSTTSSSSCIIDTSKFLNSYASSAMLISSGGAEALRFGGSGGGIRAADLAMTQQLLGCRASEAGSSSGDSSSHTASTRTTVKTRRFVGKPIGTLSNKSPASSSRLQELTLTLGSGQLIEVLNKLALQDYAQIFQDEEIDLDAFVELTPQDLDNLGIKDQATKVKMKRAILSLKSKMRR